ncbi:hypothetical protein BWI17_09755 [Betaproteobacteria bacterium GR16-43]|nr:hypothetical protein BWI17_09755 [Betaproteobacteria bacterium GR16-43]
MNLPYTAILGAHTLGFVLLVGAIVVFDLRVLGFAKQIPLRELSRLTLPVCFAAVVLAVGSGVLMLNAHAQDLLASRALQVKLALIVAAALNAAFFRTGPWTTVAAWNVGVPAPFAARASAALSIALWLGVLACGRLVAAFIRP